jgi:Fe-S-cluster-containing dehydrogenase component
MMVDADRCLGSSCGQCAEACPAAVPRFYPPEQDYSLVCDLCERNGVKKPQCVEICPSYALEFLDPRFPQHLERVHPDDKAVYLAKRLYPLPLDQVQLPPEQIWRD